MDYSSQNEPNEAALSQMMDDAEKLAGMLNGRRWRITASDRTYPWPDNQTFVWPEVKADPSVPDDTVIIHDQRDIGRVNDVKIHNVKPPITDAIQREKAYADAKFEQRRGGGAALSVKDREAIESHIKVVERIANDIELMRLGDEVIDKAVSTLRLACLGLVRGSSPVGGS